MTSEVEKRFGSRGFELEVDDWREELIDDNRARRSPDEEEVREEFVSRCLSESNA